MADPTTIGFVGGCLPAQRGIPRSKLFHQVLMRRCRDDLGMSIRMVFDDYFRYSECLSKVRSLLERRAPEIVILSLRPQPLLAVARPSIRYVTEQQGVGRTWHPALWKAASTPWRPELDCRDVRPIHGEHRIRRMARLKSELHLLAGRWVGLSAWAAEYVAGEIAAVHAACKASGVPLLVLGMPASPETVTGNAICRSASQRAASACRDMGVGYVACFATRNEEQRWLFEADGVHFNEWGHRFVAERLAPALPSLLRRTRNAE